MREDRLSQAVPVSVTHDADRNAQVLAQISTPRHLCRPCHDTPEKFPGRRLERTLAIGCAAWPTTRSNAATATTTGKWTSPARACARSACTRPIWRDTCIDCHQGIAHELPFVAHCESPSGAPRVLQLMTRAP